MERYSSSSSSSHEFSSFSGNSIFGVLRLGGVDDDSLPPHVQVQCRCNLNVSTRTQYFLAGFKLHVKDDRNFTILFTGISDNRSSNCLFIQSQRIFAYSLPFSFLIGGPHRPIVRICCALSAQVLRGYGIFLQTGTSKKMDGYTSIFAICYIGLHCFATGSCVDTP